MMLLHTPRQELPSQRSFLSTLLPSNNKWHIPALPVFPAVRNGRLTQLWGKVLGSDFFFPLHCVPFNTIM